MAVDMTLGSDIAAGVPQMIQQPPVNVAMTREPTRHQLAAAPDGQRFALRVPPGAVQAGRPGVGSGQAATVFDPATGQAGGRGNLNFNAGLGAAAAGGGRGTLGGASGLTVIENWPSIAARRKD